MIHRDVKITKICLTGLLRSGKDTVADYLYAKHGFYCTAFGDSLKRTVAEVFPWSVTSSTKPRALLQQYGQLMREIDPDVWVRHVERKIDAMTRYYIDKGETEIGVVISDLRQPNEYEWARANGFTIIRVTAPEELRLARARLAGDDFTESDLDHDTESHVGKFEVDYEIINGGTVEELQAKVDEIMAEISGVK
ncbi:AAA family ATPase [Bacillus sp. 03113]|uniref:deoxynucleotide monophosphate kinase family protein n=1 Tax=Bacillus sp. 03113 TaxID=2578211 RepID=UPI0011432EC1|nr:AAA family ATPase [Bacillus sp. 03113]